MAGPAEFEEIAKQGGWVVQLLVAALTGVTSLGLAGIIYLYKENRKQWEGRFADQKDNHKLVQDSNEVLGAMNAANSARTEALEKSTEVQISTAGKVESLTREVAILTMEAKGARDELRRFRDWLISKGMPT